MAGSMKKTPPKSKPGPKPSARAAMSSSRKKVQGSADTAASSSSRGSQALVVEAFSDICKEATIDGMIKCAVASVKRLLHVEAASCFLLDKTRTPPQLRAHHGGEESIHVPSSSGIVGSCFASGTSEIIMDAYQDERFDLSVDAATGFVTRNILAVPVLHNTSEGTRSGVFAVFQAINSPEGSPFGKDDVAILELLATLLSSALERTMLSETAQRERRRSDSLLQATIALHSTESPAMSKALDVLEAVCHGLECERASMLIVDEVHAELFIVSTDADAMGLRVPISTGVAGAVVRSGQSVRLDNVYDDDRFCTLADQTTGFRTCALLAVPVTRPLPPLPGAALWTPPQTKVDCVVEAINKTSGSFTVGDEQLLTAVALQVGANLLPEWIEHMAAQGADDTGMGLEELAGIRAVLAAEYTVANYDGHNASAAAIVGDPAAARTAQSTIAEVMGDSSAAPSKATPANGANAAAALPLGHDLARRLSDPSVLRVAPLEADMLLTPPRGQPVETWLAWDVDYLDLSPTELMQLAGCVLQHSGVLSVFQIPIRTAAAFLAECCSRYRPNPYHNFHHGVQVMHHAYMHALAGVGVHAAPLTPLETLSLLIAAIGHDVEHPGVTNAFLARTGAPLAIEHNDRSVLENHHAATTFRILARPECNMLGTLSEQQRREARELIIATILATDMAHHVDMVSELSMHAAGHHGSFTRDHGSFHERSSVRGSFHERSSVRGSFHDRSSVRGSFRDRSSVRGSSNGSSAAIAPRDVLRAFCHVADLGNVVLRWELAEPWSVRVGAEVVVQAVEEHRLGLWLPKTAKLTPYSREELAARQLVFIDDWVRPLYNVAAILFPGALQCLPKIEANREACKRLLPTAGETTVDTSELRVLSIA